MKIKTILVPIDFSKHSEFAFERAIELAKQFGSRIDLLHAYDIPNLSSAYQVSFPDQFAEGIRESTSRQLESMKERAAREGVEATTHVAFGRPERVIVDHAEEAEADMIVMATRGLGAVKHLLLGSVAERTVRTARCPVLTMASRDESEG
jgi:nucleotide-binding universal stress UspA family protein